MNKRQLIERGDEILDLIHPIMIPLFGDYPKELGVESKDFPKVKEWVENISVH